MSAARGGHRAAAVLAVRLARKRTDALTVTLATRPDANARRMIEVLGCVEPLLVAVENLLPEPKS
jgi:hypothetical protein